MGAREARTLARAPMRANPRIEFFFPPTRRIFRGFALLAIGIFCAFGSASTAQAEIVWQQDTQTGGQGFGLGIVTEYAWQFSATSTFAVDSIFVYLAKIGSMDADSCVRMLIYASSSGAVGDPIASSANCVTETEITATTTASATSHEFAFLQFELTPDDYFLALRHEGDTGSCAGVCLSAQTTVGADSYFRNGGAWTYNSATIMRAVMYGTSGSQNKSIVFTTPTNGSQINASFVPVTITYNNPTGISQIRICEWNPDTLASMGGVNPCLNGGITYGIGSSGTVEYLFTNSASSSHMVISAGFGLSFDYIPSGVRYTDYDYTSIGFYTTSADSVATSTPNPFSKYAGLDCGGFNIEDNLKCAGIFLFVPDYDFVTQMEHLADDLASTTPFGYFYDLTQAFQGYASAGTSSLTVSVELSGMMNFLGGSYATTSVTILSGSGLRATMGTTMWNLIQNLLIACMWFGFAIYVYRRSIHLL